jgi:predicted anti-sigma-YlaC factor YlaD
MKKNCGIIKDLIPMYVENLTSEDSNQLIKEHLHTCEDCANFLRNVDSDLPNDDLLDIDVDEDDRKLMKGIKHRMNSMMFIAILIGILIGLGLSLKFFSFALVGLVSFLLFIGFLIYFVNKNVEAKNEKRGKK